MIRRWTLGVLMGLAMGSGNCTDSERGELPASDGGAGRGAASGSAGAASGGVQGSSSDSGPGGASGSGGAASGGTGGTSNAGTGGVGGSDGVGGSSGVGGSGGVGGSSGAGGSGGTGGGEALEWTNPLVRQRADPHVLLHSDGYYYLTATVPAYDSIELRRAQTLNGLGSAQPKVLWKRPAQGAMAGPIWAPEIHFVDGKWYVYVSAGEGGQPWDSIRIYGLENASANPLEGAWTVKGRIQTKWDSFSLDATMFGHSGARYFVWTQVEPGRVGTNIMIARMASPTALTGEQVILSRPELPWEVRGGVWVNEAPAVLVKNGKVFLAYSASATDQNYCMGLLTADAGANLLDPGSWSKATEPVFQSSDATSQYGPGHNSFTTTPDGNVDLLVYHARNFKEIPGGNPLANPDRATRAQVLPWRPDGTPDFGRPVADGPYRVLAPSP